MLKNVVFMAIFGGLLLGNSFLLQASSVDKEVCRTYIVMFCTRCHQKARICKVLGTKDEIQWRSTVNTMSDYDNLDTKTRETVFSCLSPLPPNDPLVCK